MKEWNNFLKKTNMIDWASDDELNDESNDGFTEVRKMVRWFPKKSTGFIEVGKIDRWFPEKKFGFIKAFIKGKTNRNIFFLQTEYTQNSCRMPPKLNQKVKMTLINNNNGGFVAKDIYLI